MHVSPTPEAAGEALADRLLDLVRAKPDAVIGLATGRTPRPLYRALAARGRGAFGEARFVALDEYVGLPPGHPASFASTLTREVEAPLRLPNGRIAVPDGRAADRAGAAAAFEAHLDALGGVDVWIAGLGSNGHVAFNEPGSPPDGATRDVMLAEATRAANADAFGGRPVPTHAITVGLGTLRRHAREVALMVTGEAKRAVLARAA